MGRRGKRRRIAKGVYDDLTGRAIVVRDPQTGRPKEFRHPPGTPISVMREDAERWRSSRRASRASSTPYRGTLDHAIDQWGTMEQHLASWRERRSELRAWSALYGPRRLHSLTEHDVRRAISLWATTPLTTVKTPRPASPSVNRNRKAPAVRRAP